MKRKFKLRNRISSKSGRDGRMKMVLGVVESDIPSLTVQSVLNPKSYDEQTAAPNVSISDAELFKFITKMANNAWKLQRKMVDMDGNPKDQFDRVYRFVEAQLDALKEMGVTIKGHDGEVYDTGMAVNVVAWEKREGASREEICETIKPTIRLGDRLLQWADVVAVTPVANSEIKQETSSKTIE